jgi:hypothetical protein
MKVHQLSSKVYRFPLGRSLSIGIGADPALNMDIALEQALLLFWRKGYLGASLTDLTKVMGSNRPSLYSAFGNKETLFRKALDRDPPYFLPSVSE